MEKKFNIGDIVKLKSGSPEMTVIEHVIEAFTGKFQGVIKCAWFVDGNSHTANFDQGAVEKA